MHLRNVLLLLSVVMIGFCLTLYFQSSQEVETMNWDQYKNLQYNEERSHSLEELEEKISPYNLEDLIHEKFEKNKLAGEKTRVMEIGAGNGRVLMGLQKLFPEVEFYGINKEKTHTFYRRESYILTGLKFELFTKAEMDAINLPYIVFQDLDFGAKIPYDENKFDIVFSQNTLNYIKYKFELLNEVMRVLKHGGVSFHTDVNAINVYSKGVVIPMRDGLALIRKQGIEISLLDNAASIRFKKGISNSLFPVTPHQMIPEETQNLSQELRRPEMGYNLNP
jgi:ubiquinone/menaquinone biosynthesis C-methylase UbiE